MASHAPLPTPESEDEAYKLELLRAVETQYPVLEPAQVPEEADSQWDGQHMTEAEVESTPPHIEPAHPAQPSLFVVQITPELAPVAKVGGLADVVFGLASEMEIRGNHVEIILPKYDCLRYDHIWGFCETFRDLWVPWFGGAIHCTVYFGFVHGRKCFFIEPHSADNFFNRGCIYGFNDDVMRFAFFTRAAMEFLWKSGKHPDIIHCHDWQTALAPVFLYEVYQHLGMTHPRACFTIHNFKHQGVTGAQLLHATGLNRPDYYFNYERMRDNHNPHAINLMKAGVVYSNFVTTVSPRHAVEAKDQGQGFGLEPTLHIHHNKYGGVINGIDYGFWNPEIDPLIPVHYSADNVDGKYANKRALRERLLLADNEKPIVAFVGRLDPQKGLELIRHAIFNTLARGGQFVLLGSSPDGQINNYFWSLKHQLNDNPDCHIEIGFNEELSHLIYAGADLMLVPSRFEPCGLTQLIAMRYGSIPVVREVGGLVDTVFDKDFSNRPLHERNGYIFRDYNETGLESALGRAIDCYYQFPDHFRHLIVNAMRSDYSWKNPGQDYLNIYHHIRDK
ncbi:glycogen synthase [Methylococcus sp. EFPC2]|uniref:glycogen synthase n=1 Tax=Methylococcus sp. EFPC2 TaxID=2812648 RepID=UPI001F07C451|nr:glycogen synthase [Methylococcus sp. EFPC2]